MTRDDSVAMLRAAACEELDAHVRLSEKFGSAPIKYEFTAVAEQIDEESHGLPVEFAGAIGIYYAGILKPAAAKLRASQLLEGRRSES